MRHTLARIARRAGVERRHVASARMCCERHILAAAGRSRRRWVGRILCYHSIGQAQMGVNDVTPQRFRRHIELALKRGYKFVPASEIARTGGKADELAITFDDGLKSILTEAAPVLRDYNIPWTFFPVSGWAEQEPDWAHGLMLDWNDIEQLMASGAEMGSHSATHPDFGTIGLEQITDELGVSREMFAKRLGLRPDMFAIPLGQSGNWTKEAAAAAKAAGYATIFAQAEETRPAGTVARTFITKFDGDRLFGAVLKGKFDRWEEWV